MNPLQAAHDKREERRARWMLIREWTIAGILLAGCVFVPLMWVNVSAFP